MANAIKSALQGHFLGHPLHPIAVHLPIGLWITSLIFDILYFSAGNPSFAEFSYYLILIGLIGSLLASPAGLADYVDIPKGKPKRIAFIHLVLNSLIISLYVFNLYLRYRQQYTVPDTVTSGPFLLSLFTIVILAISGYLGGLLVYEYGIGVRRPKFSPKLSPKLSKDTKGEDSEHRAA